MLNLGVNPPWICDRCGEPIETVEDGWVEWLSSADRDDSKEHGLRLVHHVKCIYDSHYEFRHNRQLPKDLPLEEFLGADGLMRLLAMLHERRFSDNNEVLEIIKRLFIPGYEHARQFLDEAESHSVFSPNTAEGYPHQYQIELVLDWAKEQGFLE